jgi:hypothetical protein
VSDLIDHILLQTCWLFVRCCCGRCCHRHCCCGLLHGIFIWACIILVIILVKKITKSINIIPYVVCFVNVYVKLPSCICDIALRWLVVEIIVIIKAANKTHILLFFLDFLAGLTIAIKTVEYLGNKNPKYNIIYNNIE